jgi:hypothetical protein
VLLRCCLLPVVCGLMLMKEVDGRRRGRDIIRKKKEKERKKK